MKEIHISKGMVTIVSDCDFDELSRVNWCANNGYAARRISNKNGNKSLIGMHRQILGLTYRDGKFADHINGNKLDNRRENLRICSLAENVRNQKINKKNTSGFKGVCWNKACNKWIAKIKINGHRKHLGLFDTPESAHAAYCAAATDLHGEFARFA